MSSPAPQRTHVVALLEVARLVARSAPPEETFAVASEQAARLLGVEAASVMRFIGEGRAVVVGVWRVGGTRSMPVNAELDFDCRNSALGRAWTTREPARAATYEGVSGELPVIMRASGLRSSVAAPVLCHGGVWGALVASTTRDEPIAAEAERWLAEIAGLVAQAVANQDARRGLEASRLRLVEAADDARRRLERVLHEGAQQHVLSLTLKLKLARSRAPAGSELGAAIEDALLETMEADAALRDLARALFPAALAERGLGAALQGLAARAAVPVHLQELPSRRFAPVVEATAYFAVAEALAGVAEHGEATQATVRVADAGDRLVVEVGGDGAGPHESRLLRALADRAAAAGGRLEVESPPGGGAMVRTELPIA